MCLLNRRAVLEGCLLFQCFEFLDDGIRRNVQELLSISPENINSRSQGGIELLPNRLCHLSRRGSVPSETYVLLHELASCVSTLEGHLQAP